MRVDEFMWDAWNVEHIAGHGVEPEEVESLIDERSHLARRAGTTRYDLPRYDLFGRTHGGRYLFVVLDRVEGNRYYTVTARDMTRAEKRAFRKAKGW